MVFDDNRRDDRKTRRWERGERSKVSVMHAFRAAHHEHDARVERRQSEDGGTEITNRSKQRREGLDEGTLRAHIQADLNALMNTINLNSTVDLDDAPLVAQSVVNYGFRDLSNVTARDLAGADVVTSIRQSLLDHEPRLNPASVEIEVIDHGRNTDQRLSLRVSAELMGDPVDIPIDFEAEVDLGAGKLHMSKLRVQG
ncbi:type VI secretion system baseplate subunit TssE [Aliiroseovarius sp.]|uniref:type VI secretion system baseplate subunit TssE n=1 Tax=Aliiroseovarius sp. TaxID=1872442 RepID=UPI003BABE835